MRLYDSIKYASKHGLGLHIEYNSDEDFTRIIVSKKDGVSLYQKEMRMYGMDAIDPRKGDLLFGNVKHLVDDLQYRLL